VKNRYLLVIVIACLTLGLAPMGESHIIKQYHNLTLGRPMAFMDWLDVLMHGTPWVLLLIYPFWRIKQKAKKTS
jgi:hypothetical protein